MRDRSIEQALSQATADVLETMFFAGVVTEADEIEPAGPQIAIRVPFGGGRQGILGLRISEGAARTLAADFLGVETEDGPKQEQVYEVVRELANMICGNALSRVEKRALRLDAPEAVPAAEPMLAAAGSHRSFDLGNGTLTVALAFGDGGNG